MSYPNEPETAAPASAGADNPADGFEPDRQSWLAQLADTDVIAVTGPDSERFLQGQLSCDMSRLTATQSLRAALCNLKGRVVADLRVLRHEDRILLICSAGMADVVLNTLNKYKVFLKTELQVVSEQYVALGIAGKACVQALSASGVQPPGAMDACTTAHGAVIVRVQESPARFYCILSGAHGELAAALSSRCETGTEQDWRLADIVAGIAHIRPGQQELYTPQVLNYDINGVIDFRKGCYTGQEVVARMYYRAEAKKRLQHITVPDAQPLPENAELVDSIKRASGLTEALVILPVMAG